MANTQLRDQTTECQSETLDDELSADDLVFCYRHLRECPTAYCYGNGEGCYSSDAWSSEWNLND